MPKKEQLNFSEVVAVRYRHHGYRRQGQRREFLVEIPVPGIKECATMRDAKKAAKAAAHKELNRLCHGPHYHLKEARPKKITA